MYLAEIKGKVPSRLQVSEDLLTSNVFSFFKYADRDTYLKKLLIGAPLHLELSSQDVEHAEFLFWPTYVDGTEPDVVIIVGKYYILFEAKYTSGFGKETETTRCQLEREKDGGQLDAKVRGKDFIPVAITAHFTRSRADRDGLCGFEWINWQKISMMLLDIIEQHGEGVNDYEFAMDLYHLLDRKGLRGFRSFTQLGGFKGKVTRELFFSRKSTFFRRLPSFQYVREENLFFRRNL